MGGAEVGSVGGDGAPEPTMMSQGGAAGFWWERAGPPISSSLGVDKMPGVEMFLRVFHKQQLGLFRFYLATPGSA